MKRLSASTLDGALVGVLVSMIQASLTIPTGEIDPLSFLGGAAVLGVLIGGLFGLALGWCRGG